MAHQSRSNTPDRRLLGRARVGGAILFEPRAPRCECFLLSCNVVAARSFTTGYRLSSFPVQFRDEALTRQRSFSPLSTICLSFLANNMLARERYRTYASGFDPGRAIAIDIVSGRSLTTAVFIINSLAKREENEGERSVLPIRAPR